MTCRGICTRKAVSRTGRDLVTGERIVKNLIGRSPYFSGIKKCSTCEVWLVTSDIFCECCGIKLGYKPRIITKEFRVVREKLIHRF